MARGQKAKPGDTRVAPNGYHYTRLDTRWELTSRIKMEEKLGRRLGPNERVRFRDNDRTNLDPDNLYVTVTQTNSAKRAAQIRARIAELEAELEALEGSEA